ncbi:Glycosyl transferase family 1 [Eubacterium ruminantium]|nr:Glycosyl transferase family 1 [Eubacterium ruminantium]
MSGKNKRCRGLIVPMSAMAETSGPSSRCKMIAEALQREEMDIATCMAEDVNFRSIDGINNYYLDIPMPLGLPAFIAMRVFPIAQKTGITSRKRVDSFDQVLFMTGNLNYKYLRKSVSSVRKAIRNHRADFVYSEFNISACIAAKKENVPLYCTVSFPTQHEYAHRSKYAKGLNKLLKEMQLPRVDSALQVFDWTDKSFCPSIRKFEPIDKENIYYCGALRENVASVMDKAARNKIVVYMGNGTISAKRMLKVIREAFKDSEHEVYIASSYLKKEDCGKLHVAPRWDFNKLLDEAVLFINHGGQNSMVDGLLHGVPQIVVPGKVFERKYNAACIMDNHAGMVIRQNNFNARIVRETAERIISNDKMYSVAKKIGNEFRDAGGLQTIICEYIIAENVSGCSD